MATRSDAERRVRELRAEIRHHDYLYYVKDRPEIADEAYDALFHELGRLEARHPDLRTPDSPTQRVAGRVFDRFPAVEHLAPMLSLDSGPDAAEVRRFDERLRKELGDDPVRYVLEPKLDGASVELVYEAGVLVRASTRGDGVHGEGITDNIRTIATIPLRLATRRAVPRHVALRGEVIMRVGAFEELNERLLAEGDEPFANPRNAAAGSLRQLDPTITARRPLDIYVYDILAVEGATFGTDHDALKAIAAWGLPVTELTAAADGVDEVLAYHADLLARRDELDFEIDGIVIKLDDLATRARLGTTSRHPRWAYAFKFPPRREVTRVLRIVASVGRTGVVTPVALMRPVELSGVTVSRATLHNREEVARKDVREGDLVRVQRAGDVIPQVLEVVEEPGRRRGARFRMPDVCPSCGTALVERGPYTVCTNGFHCAAQLAGRIQHYASRQALDIEGLGEESSRLFVTQGLVMSLEQIYDLTAERLVALEGFAEKSAANLLAAIDGARATSLPRFLYGLGIPEVGAAVARDLARHFGSFAAVRDASVAELDAVGGIGEKMAEVIAGFFADRQNAAVIRGLLERVRVEENAPAPTGGPLAGSTFVFTGGLGRLSRDEGKRLVESLGARAVGSVSKKTTYVVAGTEAGSKLAKAEELGLEILDEDAFLKLLAKHGGAPVSMANGEIAAVLEDVGMLLQIRGANPFRIRAYENAARAVEDHGVPLRTMVAEGADLTELAGIGKDMARYITELVTTGRLGILDELTAEIPRSLLDLVRLPGVGPKRARKLWEALGITTLDALEAAARDGRVEELDGFGKKTQQRILEGIGRLRERGDRLRLVDADERIAPLLAYLRTHQGIRQLEVAGSLRRRQETIGDIDILATATDPTAAMAHFTGFDGVSEVTMSGDTRGSVVLGSGLQVDLRIVPGESWGAALQYFTGSKAHNVKLRKRAVGMGLSISEYAVTEVDGNDGSGGNRVAGETEESVYAAVGLPWIPPELREDRGEIELAAAGSLPSLVTLDDIRGDLQMHTTWSDGKDSVATMVDACATRGYAYLAITDHSKNLAMTGGLDGARLRQQWAEMDEVMAERPNIRLLRSMEVDILRDGSLDLEDELLERLDVVLVSVHTLLDLPAAAQTKRIVAALEHPVVHILAHPTGRLINRRDPIGFDLEEVLHCAREHGVAMELNAHPHRLDLRDTHLIRARELGIPIVISTDAHHTRDLDFMRYGVEQARRAGLEPAHVLNTLPPADFLSHFAPTR